MANIIKVRVDGPLLCTGDIEVQDAEGKMLEKSDDVALCRCVKRYVYERAKICPVFSVYNSRMRWQIERCDK